MMFHTTAFILGFLPVFLAGFFAVGRFCGAGWALCWLTVCSLFFYAWWNPEHVLLLLGSVAANYAIAWKLRHTNEIRAWLTAGIGFNLALLGWFKYADFFLHTISPAAAGLHITLPLAISFFTFQQIMFLVDTGRAATGQQTAQGLHQDRGSRLFPSAGHGSRNGLTKPGLCHDPTRRFRQAARLGWQPVKATTPGTRSTSLALSPPLAPSLPLVLYAPGPLVGFMPAHGLDVAARHPIAHDGSGGMRLSRFRPALLDREPQSDTPAIAPFQATAAVTHEAAALPFPPLLPYAAFVTFFAHLIAGPIVRPSEIIPQLRDPALGRFRIEHFADGVLIFLLGLGKKLVLADMFGGFADTGFDAAAHGADLTFFEAWYATLSYSLQIYFDFSGYSGIR